MSDESPEGRLERRLDRIENLLVSRNELTLSLEHLQSQIRDLKDEVKLLRTEQADDIKALRTEASGRGSNRAQAIYGVAGQIVGGIILAAIVAWVASKGAH